MFTAKEAGRVAVKAVEVHLGEEAARKYRDQFGPWYEQVGSPERTLGRSPVDDFEAMAGRLIHVQSPQVLGALGHAVSAGDRRASELLVEVITDRNARAENRLLALETLARVAPKEAAAVAVQLMGDASISANLAETLVRGSRSPDIIPALERMATQPGRRRNEKAIHSLMELGEPGSEALARCLTSSDRDIRTRAAHALMLLKISTPEVRKAIESLRENFSSEIDFLTYARLKEQLGGSSGFRWKLDRVAEKTLKQLDALDGAPATRKGPGLFGLRDVLRARVLGEGPEAGLLDWGRSRNKPLTPEQKVAESLVKLVMLRPEILHHLADPQFDHLGITHRIGHRTVGEIEIWRGEQRDSRLFVPLSRRLASDEAFRDRVRGVVRSLAQDGSLPS